MTMKFLQGGALLLGLTALLSACSTPDTTPPEPTYACPVGAEITAISSIQGSEAASPLVDKMVTLRGVVTQDAQAGLSGFFVQDVTPDNDPKTSEGLFVYTADKPQTVRVGQVLELSGTVKEFSGGTQLDTVTSVTSCGETTLPAPTKLTYPLTTADALENVEGMLVTVTTPMTVTNNYTLGRYGELGLSSGGRLFNPTNGNGAGGSGATNALRTLILDDGSSKQNPATIPYLNTENTRRTGDTVTGLEGVMHFANGTFKLEPTKTPVFTNTNPRTAAPKPVGGTLKVAGANVLNYFTTLDDGTNGARGADSAAEFERQRAKIVAELRALDADVITLMEIENNGETALDNLVTALNAAEGKTAYASVKTGTVGTDAIRVAIIYRPGKVETVGDARIDTNSVYSRPPVAQTFRDIAGKGVFTVVANHFKSKGSCPKTGDVDLGQGCWNLQRVDQARAVLAFADKLKVTDPDVLLMGDLNSYGEEDPIKALEAGGFASLNKLILPVEDRYSYQFDGQFGYLDHALASASLKGQVTGITEWHINADEPVFLDYNVEFKTPAQVTELYAPTAYRSSDHDPVVVGLKLNADGAVTTPVTVSATGPTTATVGQVYTIGVTAGGLIATTNGTRSPDMLTADWGDGAVEGLFPVEPFHTHVHTYKAPGDYVIKVTATRNSDKATDTTSLKVTVKNP
jgi:predicted extracellular nuclease